MHTSLITNNHDVTKYSMLLLRFILLCVVALVSFIFPSPMSLAKMPNTVRIATFNVSMEALNYSENPHNVSGNELTTALQSQHPQIKNIAQIIQRVNPDIILLNEFDFVNDSNIKLFLNDYLLKSQQGQSPVSFPYIYQGPVNTGVTVNDDLHHDEKIKQQPADTHGFGYFEGHFGMVLLSKFPIDAENIRTFQHFKWRDMPGALKPITPTTTIPWYSEKTWNSLRLSSKSHWDLPVNINGNIIHVLASHPTPPVFDGPENRNGNRNHDEIRFWLDYITPQDSAYIYDDKGNHGGLAPQQAFVIVGDLNASTVDGDAITDNTGIAGLLTSAKVQDAKPMSHGAKLHSAENKHAKHHTAHWRMRADYVLPSAYGFKVINSGVFWPAENDSTYSLINTRASSSDHRLVWVDVELTKIHTQQKTQ